MIINKRLIDLPIKNWTEQRINCDFASNNKLIEYFMDIIDELLKWTNNREMPIFDENWNILKYELLSFKDWFKTDDLMKRFNHFWWKVRLFKMLFSKYLLLLEKERLKNISINIWTNELLDDELIDYICSNNQYSDRITIEILEDSFEWKDAEVFKNIHKIKKAWYSIYIDDFWTWDSNSLRVRDFLQEWLLWEKDWIKLTKEMYNNMGPYKDLFSLLRNQNINIVWEWVVDEEVYNKLKKYWVNMFQWDYFEKKLDN